MEAPERAEVLDSSQLGLATRIICHTKSTSQAKLPALNLCSFNFSSPSFPLLVQFPFFSLATQNYNMSTLFKVPIEGGGEFVVTSPKDLIYLLSFASPVDNRTTTNFLAAYLKALDIL